jgi:DNA polymerase III subunit delta'
MFFRQVVGHNDLKKKLIQIAADDRISHAMLFLGMEGSGSLPLALAFASYLSCVGEKDNDACGICPSCLKYQKLIHPDLHFIFPVVKPDGAKRVISDMFIHQWRESLLANPYLSLNQWYGVIEAENKQGSIFVDDSDEIIRKLNLKTYESEYKIVIIWMVEKMNLQAGNKLLKILEEPPPKTVFLLISENTSLILPTILSRVQLIKVGKIETRELYDALLVRQGIEETKAAEIVKLADGNYLKAIELAQEENVNANLDKFIPLMRLSYMNDFNSLLGWVEEMSKMGREKQKEFLIYCIRLLRENFIMNIDAQQLSRFSEPEKEFSSKFSRFIHRENITELAEEFNKAHYHIESNGYDRLVFLDLAIQVSQLIKREK